MNLLNKLVIGALTFSLAYGYHTCAKPPTMEQQLKREKEIAQQVSSDNKKILTYFDIVCNPPPKCLSITITRFNLEYQKEYCDINLDGRVELYSIYSPTHRTMPKRMYRTGNEHEIIDYLHKEHYFNLTVGDEDWQRTMAPLNEVQSEIANKNYVNLLEAYCSKDE